jgi:hypothetical protein
MQSRDTYIPPTYHVTLLRHAISARTTERLFDNLDGGVGAQAHGPNLALSKQGGSPAGSTNGINPIRVEICAVCTTSPSKIQVKTQFGDPLREVELG